MHYAKQCDLHLAHIDELNDELSRFEEAHRKDTMQYHDKIRQMKTDFHKQIADKDNHLNILVEDKNKLSKERQEFKEKADMTFGEQGQQLIAIKTENQTLKKEMERLE